MFSVLQGSQVLHCPPHEWGRFLQTLIKKEDVALLLVVVVSGEGTPAPNQTSGYRLWPRRLDCGKRPYARRIVHASLACSD